MTAVGTRMTRAEAGNKPGHAWDEDLQEWVPLGEMVQREKLNAPVNLAENMQQFVEQRKHILKFVSEQMVEAIYDQKGNPVAGQMGDYYMVPGSGKKALTKKGGENLSHFFRIFAGPVALESQEKTKEYVDATVSMTLLDHLGRIVGSAVSSCSSAEKRFQSFGSKRKYGGVYNNSQQKWTIAPDFRAALNDVTAMARKRCFVQAVIVATATDEIFEMATDRPETKEEAAAEEQSQPKHMPVGKYKGVALRDVPEANLLECIKWCGAVDKRQSLHEACQMELERRREEKDEVKF